MYSPLQRTEIALLSPAAKLAGHLFELLDADGSGALDEEEGRTYLLSAGCVPAELDFYWRDLLRVSDGNDDGLAAGLSMPQPTHCDSKAACAAAVAMDLATHATEAIRVGSEPACLPRQRASAS